MKIINIITVDLTLRGGVERWVSQISALLVDLGFKVRIYSLCKTYAEPIYDFHPSTKLFYLTNFKLNNNVISKSQTFFSVMVYILNHQIFKKKEITITTHSSIAFLLLVFFCPIRKYIIATEHSTFITAKKYALFFKILTYKKIKKVVVPSGNSLLNFKRYGISAVQIKNPVTNFNDPRQWSSQKEERKDFFCLTVARFEDIKQLDHVLFIAKYISKEAPKIKFYLVGTGPLLEHLKNLAIDMNLLNVIFLNSRTDINEMYKIADLFLLTSKTEAFPMVMLEALSYGVPVLSYDQLVGPKELIVTGVNGYLTPQNCPSSMAKQIINLYKNKSNLRKLSENCINSVALFHSNEIIKEWRKLLN
jgi:glycosyltransferase involved in cell wall biosynthesis